jgi:hypothetical protein
MSALGWINVILGIASFGFGALAAWYWLQSTKVSTFPNWGLPGSGRPIEPLDPVMAQADITLALSRGMSESARLNRLAALYSGATALLGGLSAITGMVVAS